ncbi:hypothetical protein [Rugosimonospora africana]|uniref:Lipoprotein n=1 Tax=Rugosimonospora africana TaxID=556532 RepID=A0A8J3VN72_9ACTN|nr:hypothetical protein [Rugosimonospora africana]GIH12116.1 hypothetical protein Raf01_02880 [Rugosimonospora africana]
MPRRRLIAAAATGVLALAALTGCRFETGADAAYVGDTRFSNHQIDTLVAQLKKDGAKIQDSDQAQVRRQIVANEVFIEVAKRFSKEKGYPAPTENIDTLAQSAAQGIGLPINDAYVQLVATAEAYRELLTEKASEGTVTDADYRDAFNLLVSQQAAGPSDFAEVKQALQSQFASDLAKAVTVRNELTDAMKRYNVSLNPRYQPAGITLATVPTQSGDNLPVAQLTIGGSKGGAPVLDLTPTVAPTDDQSASNPAQ